MSIRIVRKAAAGVRISTQHKFLGFIRKLERKLGASTAKVAPQVFVLRKPIDFPPPNTNYQTPWEKQMHANYYYSFFNSKDMLLEIEGIVNDSLTDGATNYSSWPWEDTQNSSNSLLGKQLR